MPRHLRTLMHTIADRPLVTFDGTTWTAGDAVLWGLVDGTWHALERRVALGLALERDAAGEDGPPAEAIFAFRRERGLLAAEDLREWLRARELDAGALAGCLRRAALRDAARPGTRPAPAGDVAAVLRAEAMCDGTLARCALGLVRDAAARRALGPEAGAPVDARLLDALVAAAVAGPDRGLRHLDEEYLCDRAHAVLSVRAAQRRFVHRAATGERLERRLRGRRLELTRVSFEELRLGSAQAAREAALCLRVDGLGLSQVAARAGAPCSVREIEVGHLERPLRAGVGAGRPGDVVGPVAAGAGEHLVVHVRERRAPTLADPELRRRLCEELVERDIARQLAGRVEWHEPV